MSTTLLSHLFLYSGSPSSFGVHTSGSSSLISTNSLALIFYVSFEGTWEDPSQYTLLWWMNRRGPPELKMSPLPVQIVLIGPFCVPAGPIPLVWQRATGHCKCPSQGGLCPPCYP